jgi:hypothetical protein
MPRQGVVPTLPALIRTTTGLRHDLAALMKRFPEDRLDPKDRIFVRLLTSHWRNPFGKEYTSDQQKQIEAIKWIERYRKYIGDLEALLCGVLQQREAFRMLPLHELPIHPQFQFSADKCLDKLALQHAALKAFADRGKGPIPGAGGKLESLRTKLVAVIAKGGLDECVVKTGLHRETVQDFAKGHTKNPRGRTLEKLEEYLKNA